MLRQPVTRVIPRLSAACACVPKRTFIGRRASKTPPGRAIEGLNLRRLSQEREEYDRTRRNFLAAGAVAGVISFIYTSWRLKQALNKSAKLDSALPPTDAVNAGVKRKVVIHDKEGHEIVPTGNSTVKVFPRTIHIQSAFASPPPSDSTDYTGSAKSVGPTTSSSVVIAGPMVPQQTIEYTLVGLGTRSVSFLSITVYVVGFYVATADIAELRSRLVKRINPIATTLVSGEKDHLRRALLDPAEGEEIWDLLLRDGVPTRSAFRILPVRDTDFHHLRDGFVRAIQARSDKILARESGSADAAGAAAAATTGDVPRVAQDSQREMFGESVRQFRQAFNRGKVPTARELLMVREGDGKLRIVYSDGSEKRLRQMIGTVDDERVSRALWLNWLGGKKVASPPARESIVEGIMEFVERPVRTVAAQVV